MTDVDDFLEACDPKYMADLYHRYCHAPESVAPHWQAYFSQIGSHAAALFADDRPPVWAPPTVSWDTSVNKKHIHTRGTQAVSSQINNVSSDLVRKAIGASLLIRAFEMWGHLASALDPLGLDKRPLPDALSPETYGLSSLGTTLIPIHHTVGFPPQMTVQDLIAHLQKMYSGPLGVEFMHIDNPIERTWIQEQIAQRLSTGCVSAADKPVILKNLMKADAFERFLQVKFPGVKRFGMEGAESLIPALEAVVDRSVTHEVDDIAFAMAHRGRLGVLAHVITKPLEQIVAHFRAGRVDPTKASGSGDVKYHIGYQTNRVVNGQTIRISLASNPSHLEAVNPVLLGDVRARQAQRSSTPQSVLGILIHGDAAFCGQGLVAESLELAKLPGYATGGTIHVVTNNQVGFTTSPAFSRSSPYTSDIAKVIQAPIVHVNGDCPDAVVWAMRFAADYRHQFKHDVVVDLVCYRRHGHNEIDEPSFTQPVMYQAIGAQPSTYTLYKEQMITQGVMSAEEIKALEQEYARTLQQVFEQIEAMPVAGDKVAWDEWVEQGVKISKKPEKLTTGVSESTLKEIGILSVRAPDEFSLHPRIVRQLKPKQDAIRAGEGIDWATAESMAFGSLLLERVPVRLSGQDCGRGTFSQRHVVWVDQKTNQKYVSLNHMNAAQTYIEVIDSPLAEASVLGFEYGYSMTMPKSLVMWEAQFGDFSNGAQLIIDQFISSGEQKWGQTSGVVLLLPHGFEGQGPEHSSARMERYLQLCAQDNMRVVNCSTPANYFHALRRQVYAAEQKPLVVFSPKTLLRHKMAVSSLSQMSDKTAFQAVISDADVQANAVQRVVICSGKVYYELLQKRQELGNNTVALVRLEQYYPFPYQQLEDILMPFAHAEFCWCQEEPMNMGAWSFVDRRLELVLRDIGAAGRVQYIGRPEAASPATGYQERHEAEQAHLINQAFKPRLKSLKAGEKLCQM